MDIAGQSALEGSDSNCHYCDAKDQVKNCEKPKPDGLLGAVNLPANLGRSFTSKQPSHDQHKESHPSKDKNVWLDCAPEGMPNVEHGTTLADLSRCHASRYALSQFSENGFSGHYGEVAENPTFRELGRPFEGCTRPRDAASRARNRGSPQVPLRHNSFYHRWEIR
jgi:hypothetical protein